MRWWHRYVIFGAGVGVAVALMTDRFLHPERSLSDDRLYVFVEESCGYSVRILGQLEEDAALRDQVVPVLARPESNTNSSTSERVCRLLAADVKDTSPWYQWAGVDDDWICQRLAKWSGRVFRESFVKSPSWSVGSEPVDWRREPAVLAEHGLALTPSGLAIGSAGKLEGGSENGQAEGDRKRPPAPESRSRGTTKLTYWRGKDIGF